MAAIKNRLLKNLLFILTLTLITIGCEKEEVAPKYGNISFSFAQIASANARKADTPTPAFASYTLKKSDQSTSSNKIELYAFGYDFVSHLQGLAIGTYSLEAFQILDANNNVIYASPVAGSPLAGLVEHPLPLLFIIKSDEITSVIPEVVSTSEISFFPVTATLANNDTSTEVNYTLEIIAKDVPLGNVAWSKSLQLSTMSTIKIPTKYRHYTFRARKNGYIDHVQHFLKEDLNHQKSLAFEFIPANLEGVVSYQSQDKVITVYVPNDANRCKLYSRIDVAEGYTVTYIYTDKFAWNNDGDIIAYRYVECNSWESESGLVQCHSELNLFSNKVFSEADNFCSNFSDNETNIQKLDASFTIVYARINELNMPDKENEYYPYHEWVW